MTLLAQLNRILDRQLPGATLSLQTVPDCHGLKLYLLDPAFDDRALPLHVQESISDDPPYWIFCWASGRALARMILQGQLDVKGKRVIDFGAGSGVVAIAASLAGASEVISCEIDPVANHLISLNSMANHVTVKRCLRLEDVIGEADLLLAADVLYERKNLVWLDQFLEYGRDVIVADSRQKSLSHSGYRVWCNTVTTSFPDYAEARTCNDVTLYRSM